MNKTIKDLKKFKFIKWSVFISSYCKLDWPKMAEHKLRGLDGNNNVIDFTEEEKKEIQDGLHKFGRELLKIKVK